MPYPSPVKMASSAYNHLFSTTYNLDREEVIQSGLGIKAIKALAPTIINSSGLMSKIAIVFPLITLSAIALLYQILDNEVIHTDLDGTITRKGHSLVLGINDFMDNHHSLQPAIIGIFCASLLVTHLLGTKKVCNLLGQQVNIPKVAIRVGQGTIVALAYGSSFLSLPIVISSVIGVSLLGAGIYHAIELINHYQNRGHDLVKKMQ